MYVRPTVHPTLGLLRVLDPNTMLPLPEGGADMPLTTYWRQRWAAGETETCDPPTTSATTQASTSTSSGEHA